MRIPVRVNDGTDSPLAWVDVFRVLGIRRCHPLLRDVGAPDVIANSPEGLIKPAYYFWQKKWQGVTKKRDRINSLQEYAEYREEYRLGIQALLQDVFDMIIESYGEGPSSELYEWAQRHFVDRPQRFLWDAWGTLLVRLMGEPEIPLPLAPAVIERLTLTVAKYLPSLKGEDPHEAELMAEARRIPLSVTEQRMAMLSVTEPGDEKEIDVLLKLELVLRQQYAYRAWSELNSWLNELEREALLRWGREQAAIMNMQTEWVSLPERL